MQQQQRTRAPAAAAHIRLLIVPAHRLADSAADVPDGDFFCWFCAAERAGFQHPATPFRPPKQSTLPVLLASDDTAELFYRCGRPLCTQMRARSVRGSHACLLHPMRRCCAWPARGCDARRCKLLSLSDGYVELAYMDIVVSRQQPCALQERAGACSAQAQHAHACMHASSVRTGARRTQPAPPHHPCRLLRSTRPRSCPAAACACGMAPRTRCGLAVPALRLLAGGQATQRAPARRAVL